MTDYESAFEAGKREGKIEEHSAQIRILFENQKGHEARMANLESVYAKMVGGSIVIGAIYSVIVIFPTIQQLLTGG